MYSVHVGAQEVRGVSGVPNGCELLVWTLRTESRFSALAGGKVSCGTWSLQVQLLLIALLPGIPPFPSSVLGLQSDHQFWCRFWISTLVFLLVKQVLCPLSHLPLWDSEKTFKMSEDVCTVHKWRSGYDLKELVLLFYYVTPRESSGSQAWWPKPLPARSFFDGSHGSFYLQFP